MDKKATIEPDPKVAPHVAEAFRLLASGHHSPKQVLAWLQSQGVRISRSYIHTFPWKKAYIGVIDSFGTEHEARSPFVPIVPKHLFYQARNAFRKRDDTKSVYETANAEFPLRGTIICECGQVLTGCWSKGRSKRYAYYRCRVCSGVNVRREVLEAAFVDELDRFRVDPRNGEKIVNALLARWYDQEQARSKERRKREADRVKIRDLQGAISIKNAQGIVPDAIAKEQIERLEEKLAELIDPEVLDEGSMNIKEALRFAFDFLSRMGIYWGQAPLELKRRSQNFLYPSGLVYTKNGNCRTAENPLLEGLLVALQDRFSSLVHEEDELTNQLIGIAQHLHTQFSKEFTEDLPNLRSSARSSLLSKRAPNHEPEATNSIQTSPPN